MSEVWFRRKYKVVKANKAKFFGETDTKKHIIKINVKKSKATGVKGELLDTLTHEIQHAKHPRAGERKIEKMTKKSTKKLSKKSKNKLYNLIRK